MVIELEQQKQSTNSTSSVGQEDKHLSYFIMQQHDQNKSNILFRIIQYVLIFGFWNHVSHLQVHWIALPQNKTDMSSFMTLLEQLLVVTQIKLNDITTTTTTRAHHHHYLWDMEYSMMNIKQN